MQVIAEPVALGLLKPPGAWGADIVVGEGQAFGNTLSYGGPYLGFFATRDRYVRQMPGRLVGETVDTEGRRGYVLTLSTREQHIRREKATSNICTNEGLCALAATIHLCTLGKIGLRRLAELNLQRATYARQQLAAIPGCRVPFSGPTFNEFVLETPQLAGTSHSPVEHATPDPRPRFGAVLSGALPPALDVCHRDEFPCRYRPAVCSALNCDPSRIGPRLFILACTRAEGFDEV